MTIPIRYVTASRLLARYGHPNIDPLGQGGSSEEGQPPADPSYVWTDLPAGYGTVYDARLANKRQAGGYTPAVGTSVGIVGTPSYQQVVTDQAPFTVGSKLIGTGTAQASADTITLANHKLPNGMPVYFTALTGGTGLGTGPGTGGWSETNANWYVVTAATTNTFKLLKAYTVDRANPATTDGKFYTVNITADYSSVTVRSGVWYDQIDWADYLICDNGCGPTVSGFPGILLFTRSNFRGLDVAPDPFLTKGFATALIRNWFNTNVMVLVADSEFCPTDPVPRLDAFSGINFRVWRSRVRHCIDGLGSMGNNQLWGSVLHEPAWIYPDPEHGNGTHNDTAMQIFRGIGHLMRGCVAVGVPAPEPYSSSSGDNPPPIPDWTNSDIQVNVTSGYAAPTHADVQFNLLSGGGFQVNISDDNYPALGVFANNQHYNDNQWVAGGEICAPNASNTTVTIHADIPISGARKNVLQDGVTAITIKVQAPSSLVNAPC